MNLTTLQRHILAILEEAGEENIVSLTNTVAKPSGSLDDIKQMTNALLALQALGLIDVANDRDRTSLQWIALSRADSRPQLQAYETLVEWSDGDMLWQWRGESARPEILLTEAGTSIARQVLSEDGWPEQRLDSYS